MLMMQAMGNLQSLRMQGEHLYFRAQKFWQVLTVGLDYNDYRPTEVSQRTCRVPLARQAELASGLRFGQALGADRILRAYIPTWPELNMYYVHKDDMAEFQRRLNHISAAGRAN